MLPSHLEAQSEPTDAPARRDVLKDPAPHMKGFLEGILPNGQVTGYMATYYSECESLDVDEEGGFMRVVMYGDESKDYETRIPFEMLKAAGFNRKYSPYRPPPVLTSFEAVRERVTHIESRVVAHLYPSPYTSIDEMTPELTQLRLTTHALAHNQAQAMPVLIQLNRIAVKLMQWK